MTFKGLAGEIVEVSRRGGDVHMEWRIPGFFDLSRGCGDFYESPRFGFYDARWHLRVNPNFYSSGEVRISLLRDDAWWGPSTRNVNFSYGVRGSGGGVEKRTEELEREFKKGGACYSVYICERSELSEQKDRLMPGGTITIVCQMRVPGTAATDASTQTEAEVKEARVDDKQSSEKRDASTQTEYEFKEARVDDKQSSEKQGIEHKVLEDMGKLLDSGNKSDVTVQVQDTEFRVHSSILCARSPVLSAMLEHDTAETASHRINISDCQPEVFEEYLRYLYTGSVRSLSRQTVFGLYRVADQYLADDLKLLCLEHIRDTLCVQTFCDAVTLAVTHGESDLLRLAVDFAAGNIQPILRSVEWQNFICEHPREANEILIKSVRPQS